MAEIEKTVYFIGIGGIGMANLARYYLLHGARVAGYDRTPSDLTHALEREGAEITYTDDPALIPEPFRDPAACLAVYTPAIPEDNRILTFFREGGFQLLKRAALLGRIASHEKASVWPAATAKPQPPQWPHTSSIPAMWAATPSWAAFCAITTPTCCSKRAPAGQ